MLRNVLGWGFFVCVFFFSFGHTFCDLVQVIGIIYCLDDQRNNIWKKTGRKSGSIFGMLEAFLF